MSLQTRLSALITAIGADIKALNSNPRLAAPEAWRVVGAAGQPGFTAGWAGGGSWAAFFKDPYGMVHLKGQLFCTVAGGNPAFQLPPGYRPSADLDYPISYWNGSRVTAVVTIRPSGNVDVTNNADTFSTAVNYAGINHVHFRGEA